MEVKDTKLAEMERIDELVLRFQAGDKDCGEQLLRLFGCHPEDKKLSLYVGKYFRMIRKVVLSFDDRDSRKFISTFIADPAIREKMRVSYQYADVKGKVIELLTYLQSMWMAIPDDELKQDLRFLFIRQMVRYKHKRRKVFFTGYLYNSYRYAVLNYLKDKFKSYEPYMYPSRRLVAYQDDVYEDADTEIQLDYRTFSTQPMLASDDDLGYTWVRGFNCRDEFKRLNQWQRLILKLYYADEMNDREIAVYMNMHINTIHNHRKKAEHIVQETAEYLQSGGEIHEAD
jgi:DNA-directed RNA polymerase specialized sigma24 family protein